MTDPTNDYATEASAGSAPDPQERLEAALNRIAFALDRRAGDVPASGGADLASIAANVDALRVRVRSALALLEQEG